MIGSIGVFALTLLCGALSFGALSPSSHNEDFAPTISQYDTYHINQYNSMGTSACFNKDTFVWYDVSFGKQWFIDTIDTSDGGYYMGFKQGEGGFIDNTTVLGDLTARNFYLDEISTYDFFLWCYNDGYTFSFVPIYRIRNYDDGLNQFLVNTLEFAIDIELNDPNTTLDFSVSNYLRDLPLESFSSFYNNTWYYCKDNFPFGYNSNINKVFHNNYYVYQLSLIGGATWQTTNFSSFELRLRVIGDVEPNASDYYQQGYSAGINDGYNNGYQNGYNAGYSAGLGVSSNVNGGFMNLFTAIADTPIIFLKGLFSFDLFGVSVLTIILSLLTGFILLFVIKKVIK